LYVIIELPFVICNYKQIIGRPHIKKPTNFSLLEGLLVVLNFLKNFSHQQIFRERFFYG